MFLLPFALTIFGSSILSPVRERFSGATVAGASSFFALGGLFLAGFVSVEAAVAVSTFSGVVTASFAADLAGLGFFSGVSVFFLDSGMIKLFRFWPLYSALRQRFSAAPCACAHWYWCADPEPAIHADAEFHDNN